MSSLYFQTTPAISIHAQLTLPTQSNSQKPLIVFLHYWGGSSSTWHKFTTPDTQTSLTALYPTLAIDLRGWGKSTSTGPAGVHENEYSITAMASDIATILSQMKAESNHENPFQHGFVLVGHSMGAKITIASLSLLSQDLQALLRGLILVTPAPPTALDLPADMKAQQQVAYESEEAIRWTIANVLANPDILTDSDTSLIVQSSLGGNSLAKKAWPMYGMQEDVSRQAAQALGAYHDLRASIIVGELDVVEPKERVEAEVVNFLTRNKVEVTFKTVKGVKHLIPLENPVSIHEEVCKF
ncbi:alpha/beta hydrolase [Penicillium cosmopolitanum]|uniref:Alpha/beta hydrolase n=1 Tax=Penicillium cosmopolitanum TaxID=1131564 RepID=A0A9W9W0W1_9EURO|nr:alpha/beta hydrolase [Penicillium cosmopolitanum]KAJ5396620.1 alpha/beta hydrolase [Penicillium cosmopolitanum]